MVPILHMRTLRVPRHLLPLVGVLLMSRNPLFQVPPVDDVLHRLKDVPEANFSSMVQRVSPILVTWSPPA